MDIVVASSLEESRLASSRLKIDYSFIEELKNAGALTGVYSRIADVYKDSVIYSDEIDLQVFKSKEVEHHIFQDFLKILRDAKNGNKNVYFVSD